MKTYTCPGCQTDVVQTGFTRDSKVSQSFMLVGGKLQQITETTNVMDVACCLRCGKRLPICAGELLKAA